MCQFCEFYRWFSVELFPDHFGIYIFAALILMVFGHGLNGDLKEWRDNPSKRPDPLVGFKKPLPSELNFKPKKLFFLIILLMAMPIIEGVFIEIMCGKNIWIK